MRQEQLEELRKWVQAAVPTLLPEAEAEGSRAPRPNLTGRGAPSVAKTHEERSMTHQEWVAERFRRADVLRSWWVEWLCDEFGGAGSLVLATWTYRDIGDGPPSRSAVEKGLGMLLERLRGADVKSLTVVEQGALTQRFHQHSLIAFPAGEVDGAWRVMAVMGIKAWWEAEYGFTSLEAAQARRGVSAYVAKYVIKASNEAWPVCVTGRWGGLDGPIG